MKHHLSPVAVFALSALLWVLGLTLVWSLVAKWTSAPAAVLAEIALEQGAPGWVRAVHRKPGSIEAETRIEVLVPNSGGRRGAIVVEADPARYTYGLPILLGLLLAARGAKGPRRPARALARAVASYALLLPAQAFSLGACLLMEMVLAARGDLTALKAAGWQLEAIAYAFQLGTLVVPTLVPMLIWLWMDRRFVADVMAPDWHGRAPVVP
jgi:hypothetical protein